jgi:cation diffusion facilitator CzcD-associated flavoprotein CzcO
MLIVYSFLGIVNSFAIDERPNYLADGLSFHGMMFADVPNLVWIFGYIRSSWTLRVDLVSDVVCRCLNYMREQGLKKIKARFRPEDQDM